MVKPGDTSRTAEAEQDEEAPAALVEKFRKLKAGAILPQSPCADGVDTRPKVIKEERR